MSIVPDSKDWTWVLERTCPECGFDASVIDDAGIATRLRDIALSWPALLADERVRARPDPQTWSALEYGCHVRDVFSLFTRRLELMLTEDDPLFASWNQDETAIEDRYTEQDPSVVAEALVRNGEEIAVRFRAIQPDQWSRPGRRSDGAVFTVSSFGRYLLHDPTHHVADVERGYTRLEGTSAGTSP